MYSSFMAGISLTGGRVSGGRSPNARQRPKRFPIVALGVAGLAAALLTSWPAFAVTLANAPGDGQVSIDVDAYGSFGYQTFGVGTGDALFDPVGAVGPSSTSWESALYFRQPGSSIFLSTGIVGTTGESGGLADPGFTATGPTAASSSFTYAGLEFQLEQRLDDAFPAGGGPRSGSTLVQTYTVTNPGPSAASFDLVRYYEGDLFLGGAGIPDGGGHLFIGATEFVFETDEAGQPATSTTFVGISAVGGTIPAVGRYEVGLWSSSPPGGFPGRISADLPLGDVVHNDGSDADEFVDAGLDYDVGIALANEFTLGPGEQVTYVTMTLFGSGAPADVPTTTSTTTTTSTSTTTTTSTSTTTTTSTSTTSTTSTSTTITTSSTTSSTTTSVTTSTTTTTLPPSPGQCAFLVETSGHYNNAASIAGDLGANDADGQVRIGRRSHMADGTTIEAMRVFLGNGASADSVLAETVRRGRNADVRGSTGHPTLPLADPFCPTPEFDCGGVDVMQRKGDPPRTLMPGSYGNVQLQNGTTLWLEAGTYWFCTVKTGRRVEVLVLGGAPSTLNVLGEVRLGNGSTLGPEPGAPTPTLHVRGQRLRVAANASLQAFVSAPDATTNLGRQATLTGSLCALRATSGHGIHLACAGDAPASTTTSSSSTTSTTTTSSTQPTS